MAIAHMEYLVSSTFPLHLHILAGTFTRIAGHKHTPAAAALNRTLKESSC